MIRQKEDLLFAIIVIAVTWIAWHGVLDQMISGEGFIYFSPSYSLIVNGHFSDLAHNIDNFPRILHFLLEKWFGGNLQPYMNTMFTIIVLVNLSIYWLVKKITNTSTIALLSAVFASSNFISSYQFYARGHYQWFSQRVPQLIPIFLGIYCLFIFLQKNKKNYYILSLFFFILAMFTNYYTTLSLPLYIGFIVAYTLSRKNWTKSLLRIIFLALPFILISYYLNSNSGLNLAVIRPNQTFLETLVSNKDVLAKISFQLSVITFPIAIKEFLADLFRISLKETVSLLIIPSILLYLSILVILLKKHFDLFKLSIALLLATIGTLYLNVYLGRVNVYNEVSQGRYYYNSSIYAGIIWASFFYVLSNQFLHKKILKVIFIGFILLAFVSANIKYIWKNIDHSQYEYTGGKKLLQILVDKKDYLPAGSIVFLPQPLMPLGEDFLKKYYSGQNTRFLYIDSNWKSKVPKGFDINKLFVFDYNDEFGKRGRSNVNEIDILDKSEQFRKELVP